MKTGPVHSQHRSGVIAVPPLCRRDDGSLDWSENSRLIAHLRHGGIRRFMYGGNAFLHHLTLLEYEALLEWLSGLDDDSWIIPAAGPSFGRLMDQAPLLRRHSFSCAMALPCADPRDAAGLEAGLRRFSDAAALPLTVYLKEENNLGADPLAGLDALARLVQDGVCCAIKYAVVRSNPLNDPYLTALLERVDRRFIISGMGERPALDHLRHHQLPGFTSGSVCVAPALSQALFEACQRQDWPAAASLRQLFLPLEDFRDASGPARVLHAAVTLAGIAHTGPIPPFVSALSPGSLAALQPIARALT
jgi:dihydrodipicolinate synthase/N-acetylneuraminate lyase